MKTLIEQGFIHVTGLLIWGEERIDSRGTWIGRWNEDERTIVCVLKNGATGGTIWMAAKRRDPSDQLRVVEEICGEGQKLDAIPIPNWGSFNPEDVASRVADWSYQPTYGAD